MQANGAHAAVEIPYRLGAGQPAPRKLIHGTRCLSVELCKTRRSDGQVQASVALQHKRRATRPDRLAAPYSVARILIHRPAPACPAKALRKLRCPGRRHCHRTPEDQLSDDLACAISAQHEIARPLGLRRLRERPDELRCRGIDRRQYCHAGNHVGELCARRDAAGKHGQSVDVGDDMVDVPVAVAERRAGAFEHGGRADGGQRGVEPAHLERNPIGLRHGQQRAAAAAHRTLHRREAELARRRSGGDNAGVEHPPPSHGSVRAHMVEFHIALAAQHHLGDPHLKRPLVGHAGAILRHLLEGEYEPVAGPEPARRGGWVRRSLLHVSLTNPCNPTACSLRRRRETLSTPHPASKV